MKQGKKCLYVETLKNKSSFCNAISVYVSDFALDKFSVEYRL